MNALLIGLKHIKTTLGGLAAIAAGIGLLAPELAKLARGEAPDAAALKMAGAAIAAGVSLLFAKDADKSNAPTPTAAPVATPRGFSTVPFLLALLGLVAVIALLSPRGARADVDPTAGTVDGAGMASAVAESAPGYRWSLELPLPGKPLLVPAIAIAPFAVDLKSAFSDGRLVFTRAFNIGGGGEVLWRASSSDPVGFAVHGLMRATDSGPRAMASLLAVLPLLSRAGLRPGIGYQLGGHAVFLLEGATSFGFAPAAR